MRPQWLEGVKGRGWCSAVPNPKTVGLLASVGSLFTPFIPPSYPFQVHVTNSFTASCENAITLSVPGVPVSCEKFPHSSQLNCWSTESIFNQFSVFLKTLNALCVCLQYKHPRSMKRVIRSEKPVTLLLLFWSHKCDIGAEPRSSIIATSAAKGLNSAAHVPILLLKSLC
jgi:hypothetical protein